MELGLSLGSNLGDRAGHLAQARHEIAALPKTRIVAQSKLYETEPVGVRAEHRHLLFLNGALIVETDLSVEEAQRALSELELKLGRRRELNRFAPRTVDIDLLYAGDLFMETENLTLPHPRWAQRRFVVQPLADVRPDLVLPGAQRSIRETLAALPAGEAVREYAGDW